MKAGFVGLMLSAAAVSILVQCAPKDAKKNELNEKKDKPTASSPTDGMDFSTLEKSESNKSAKALLEPLKKNETPDGQIISIALVEVHLKKDARSNETRDQVLARIAKYAETVKPQKLEDLKNIYGLIEEEQKRNLRYDSKATSILNVMDQGEVQEYSGTSFLALAWLQARSLKRSNAVVVIEDGNVQLGEIRNKNVFTLNPIKKGAVARDQGSLEDLAKNSSKRVVQLDLFLIHEALKPFVPDAKAWAIKIQKISNSKLNLKIDGTKLTTNPASVDKSQVAHSELLIGKPRDGATADLETEDVTGETDKSSTKTGEPDTKAGADGSNGAPAVAPPEAMTVKDGKAALILLNKSCVKPDEFDKMLSENKQKNLLEIFKKSSVVAGGALQLDSAGGLMALRMESLDPKKLGSLDAELEKLLADAAKEVEKDGKTEMILVVKKDGRGRLMAILQMYEKEGQKYLKSFGNALEVKANVLDYLKTSGNETKLSDDKALIIEKVNNC